MAVEGQNGSSGACYPNVCFVVEGCRFTRGAAPAAAAQNAIGLREDDAPPLPFVGRLEAVKPGANPSD